MRAAIILIMLVGCHHHAQREMDDHPCDPSGPRSPAEPRFADYLKAELYPDELALRATCALPRPQEIPAIDEPVYGESYVELVLQDPVPLDDAALATQCEAVATKQDAATRGACRHACVVDGRARGARVLFTHLVQALVRIESSAGSCDATKPAECLGLDWLPSRMHVAGTSRDDVHVRGPLVPGGPEYDFTLTAQWAGCGQTATGPAVTLVDPLSR